MTSTPKWQDSRVLLECTVWTAVIGIPLSVVGFVALFLWNLFSDPRGTATDIGKVVLMVGGAAGTVAGYFLVLHVCERASKQNRRLLMSVHWIYILIVTVVFLLLAVPELSDGDPIGHVVFCLITAGGLGVLGHFLFFPSAGKKKAPPQ